VKKKLLYSFAFILVCLIGLGMWMRFNPHLPGPSGAGIPDTADARKIQEVILRSRQLETRAAMSYDTREFPSVFIDDPRGGKLDSTQIKLVSRAIKAGLLPVKSSPADAGYLDLKVAYFQ
jgi:hypothetical protein